MRILSVLVLVILCSLSLLAIVILGRSRPSGSSIPDPDFVFVSARGRNLYLGDKPFRFVGVNRYNLMTTGGYPYIGCGGEFTDAQLTTWFSEIRQMNVTVVRFWLFQSFTSGGTDFSRLDYLIALARQNGIRLIPVLENQWKDCTEGDYKFDQWYSTGYSAPYGNYEWSFLAYLDRVIPRYKDNPTILMWQVVNEAESQDRNHNYDPQALADFASRVSAYIKSLDPNHLVSLGVTNDGPTGSNGNGYRNLHALATIDVLDVHDYHDEASPISPNVAARIADSLALDKPLIVGEAGIASNCDGQAGGFVCYSLSQRASYVKAKMEAFMFANGGAGYILWAYRDAQPHTDVLTFEADDPLAEIIRKTAATANSY